MKVLTSFIISTLRFNYFNNKQKAQYALFIFGVWGHLPNAD
ncbi:hypothetical protein PPAR_a1110 [Pseudoalteromonas paragorgicola KMM 3548]|nr:hypothetical protein [Pseudoalteromonas distincta KMM 3548]